MPHDNSKSSYSNRCSCGTKLCYWSVRDNIGQHYCELATDTCSPIPMCSNKDGTVKLEPGSSGLGACQCGAEQCILDKNSIYVSHRPYKFKIDQFCNIGIESSPVSQATASCTLAPCANTDGTVGNPEQCQCGRDKCQRESLDATGNTIAHPGPYFCNSAKHICGITKDAMKYSITALKPNSSPPEFTQCHDTPSNVVIMDETECFQASADLGMKLYFCTSLPFFSLVPPVLFPLLTSLSFFISISVSSSSSSAAFLFSISIFTILLSFLLQGLDFRR